ncbi:hypothetical protein CGMCC3_g11348 [Colletotrichum fructicola]|nr:uncharacterized protein CGMCC3_g11348 [Colletotrichum fructicola]KAE9572686.1 hypothetical protein CGMCC3_g11348 [Colletotrichum fructicola]
MWTSSNNRPLSNACACTCTCCDSSLPYLFSENLSASSDSSHLLPFRPVPLHHYPYSSSSLPPAASPHSSNNY